MTPCAQWCINVWMLFCNWSNQIDVLYRALSDADCHLYPLLLFVLVDIMCVSELFHFLKTCAPLFQLFCTCFMFFLRGRTIWGLWVCALVILGFIFRFYSDSASEHDMSDLSWLSPLPRGSVRAVMCNCCTECVIYENEPSQLAWMVNFEKCHSVTQRLLRHIKTYH